MPWDRRKPSDSSASGSSGGPVQTSKSQPGTASSLCGSLLPSATYPNDARVIGSRQPANDTIPSGSIGLASSVAELLHQSVKGSESVKGECKGVGTPC